MNTVQKAAMTFREEFPGQVPSLEWLAEAAGVYRAPDEEFDSWMDSVRDAVDGNPGMTLGVKSIFYVGLAEDVHGRQVQVRAWTAKGAARRFRRGRSGRGSGFSDALNVELAGPVGPSYASRVM